MNNDVLGARARNRRRLTRTLARNLAAATSVAAILAGTAVLSPQAAGAAGLACAANDRFGRMFPTLTSASHSISDLQALGRLTTETTHLETVRPNNPSDDEGDIPAGYTYAGQFIDHDITLDPRPDDLTSMVDPATLVNVRTPSLDLDSVYGSGPAGSPQLYEADQLHLRLGRSLSGASTDPGARDVLRSSTGQAVLGDPRNDENRIVGSLHSLFTRYHNRVVDRVKANNPTLSDAKVFDQARREVRWAYQWAVLTDFLPQMSSAADVAQVATYGNGKWGVDLKLYNPCNGSMPLEFSTAAYRWHTMVRNDYQINGQIGNLPIFDGSFNPRSNLAGFQPAPSDFGIDWDLFFKMSDRTAQKAYKLDNSLVPGLGKLPADAAGTGAVNLSERNLLRGRQLGLPSGQAIARAMGVTPLRDDQIIVGPALSVGAPTQALTSVSPAFAGNAPLWSYLFAESVNQRFTVSGGRIIAGDARNLRLGPVGARIVNETVVGLLAADPDSVLYHPEFTPSDGDSTFGSSFGFKDIIRVATGDTPVYGAFESPIVSTYALVPQGQASGWVGTGPGGVVEVWAAGFLGKTRPAGGQVVELNSTGQYSIYRDFATVPGQKLTWSFWHAGREDADTVRVSLNSPGAATNVVGQFTTGAGAWTKYSGSYTVPAGQTMARIQLDSLDAGSAGNLVDDVVIHVDSSPPATGFESPIVSTYALVPQGQASGWVGTGPGGVVEVWAAGFLGKTRPAGGQVVELNSTGQYSIYRDFATVPGQKLTWSFWHAGREDADTVRVSLHTPGAAESVVGQFTTGAGAWTKYSGSYTVPAGQTVTRIQLDSLDSGTAGNLVDDVMVRVVV